MPISELAWDDTGDVAPAAVDAPPSIAPLEDPPFDLPPEPPAAKPPASRWEDPPMRPPPAPPPKAKPPATEAAAAPLAAPAPAVDSAAVFAAAREVDPLQIGRLEALCQEVHLVSPDLGDLYLVREHTGQQRLELTFREAAALRQMVDQFPGARVVALTRPAAPAEEGWDA
jgi:hypothetical protein